MSDVPWICTKECGVILSAEDKHQQLQGVWERDDTIPCGRCDIGVYSELAMLNKTSREFGVLSEQERQASMPMCKTRDQACCGAVDFHNMICEVDKATGGITDGQS